MFSTAFNTILRSIAIPIVAIIILRSSLGLPNAVLAICISLTLANLISIIFKIISILPNMVMLKGWRVVQIGMGISIEVFSVIGFWVYYLTIY